MTCIRLFYKFIVLYFALISVVQSDNSFSEKLDEKIIPDNIVIEYDNEQLELYLTGLTVRKKFFLNIYTMYHYIEQQSTIADSDILDPENSDKQIYKNILQNNSAKQISMVFMRKLSAKQIQKSLRSGLIKNSNNDDYLKILPQVEEFMQAINGNVDKNDEFIIRWFPDGTIVSLFKGKQISLIKDKIFAETLWAIWFGEFSVVDREALIKKLLPSS